MVANIIATVLGTICAITAVVWMYRGARYTLRMQRVMEAMQYTSYSSNTRAKSDLIDVQYAGMGVDWERVAIAAHLVLTLGSNWKNWQNWTGRAARLDDWPEQDELVTIVGSVAIGVVTIRDRRLYISFRGRRTRRETADCYALSQRTIAVTGWTGSQSPAVHEGMARIYETVVREVITATQNTRARWDRIVISGHSMGGALALLTALTLNQTYPRVCSVFTFGAPRVGNMAFRDLVKLRLGSRAMRIVNESDDVCFTPLATMPNIGHSCNGVDYTQIGELILLFGTHHGTTGLNHEMSAYVGAIEAMAMGPSARSSTL